MNGKTSKMIRKFDGGKKEKREWQAFPHYLRGLLRSEFKNGPKPLNKKPHSWPTS